MKGEKSCVTTSKIMCNSVLLVEQNIGAVLCYGEWEKGKKRSRTRKGKTLVKRMQPLATVKGKDH